MSESKQARQDLGRYIRAPRETAEAQRIPEAALLQLYRTMSEPS